MSHKSYKLKIVQDKATNLFYWAYHTPEIVVESKKNYKKQSTCELKAMNWAKKQNLDWFELFVADIEYIRAYSLPVIMM